MRVQLWRWLTFTVVLTPAVGVVALAQPPGADKKATDESPTTAERAKLQADLLVLLRRISASGPYSAPMMPPAGPAPAPKTKVDPVSAAKSLDPLREGTNYFRDNDFEAARLTFQLIDPTPLNKEDRAFVRYMLACSLRRLKRTSEAEVIYREIANSTDDEFLTSCAIWQLSLVKSEQELQLQLEQLRSRAKSK